MKKNTGGLLNFQTSVIWNLDVQKLYLNLSVEVLHLNDLRILDSRQNYLNKKIRGQDLNPKPLVNKIRHFTSKPHLFIVRGCLQNGFLLLVVG